ncbi:glycerophosphodiester phosphodiesterase family protein [Henriciella mobilis]|uniref:GP-PDE domain-containing protein n=1 Tax=Henriciella mobilis TaxID=2305467 RepID=A0A399R8Z2_9PROT|nr:glycerophosphodiester phosphodiesterase family protein [Henriciella mobilis]RIJ27900.1 hypothetical protein D1223_10765 [Henriciella mobilis]
MAERFQILDFAYAHRGLWSAEKLPENSLEAILAAAEAGLGCELDVRPAACGTPVVFHDPLLDRMTGAAGPVAAHPAEALTAITLNGGGTLPTLEEVLEAWPGKAPLLIELKIDGDTDAEAFTRTVASLVQQHDGPAAMMSFSRTAVRAVPVDIMKGALIMPSVLAPGTTLEAAVAKAMANRPDYLACNILDAGHASALAARLDLPLAIWTISSLEMKRTISHLRVAPIFEGFDPAFARP